MQVSTAKAAFTEAVTLDAAKLRTLGSAPCLPCFVGLQSGKTLAINRLLRHLPSKRIAADATLPDGRRVLAKLFFGRSASRHFDREHQGIAALAAAGIDTPALEFIDEIPGRGWAIVTEYLAEAVSFRERWGAAFDLVGRTDGGDSGKTRLGAIDVSDPAHPAMQALATLFKRLGQMHRAGLAHEDLHPGNVLLAGERLLIIDGDAVHGRVGSPLDHDSALRNFGQVVAQFPVMLELALPSLLDAWRSAYDTSPPATNALTQAIDTARGLRVADYLGKARRNCTLFQTDHAPGRMQVVMRSHLAALSEILADPDAALKRAHLLKNGRSATVGRLQVDGTDYVIKRYNIRNAAHALLRAPRPSRAWHAWIAGHRLRALGIATPEPVAVIESRLGPLRGRAWLITEHCPGTTLRWHYDKDTPRLPNAAEAAAFKALFHALRRTRITHGDLKSHNLFWQDGHIAMIDLDAMVQHRSDNAFRNAWAKDCARLLRNWPRGSELHRWLLASLSSD